jgi:hypothetical protein
MDYDMQWVPHHVALTKDFVWRCNLFGGGRTSSLVERLKKLPKFKDYVKQQGWDYGEGFAVGTPKTPETIKYLWKKPVLPAKAINLDGSVNGDLLTTQEEKCFENARPESRYEPPLILLIEFAYRKQPRFRNLRSQFAGLPKFDDVGGLHYV